MSLIRSDVFRVHHAIHDGDDEVTLSNGAKIALTMGKNKCRECVVAGWRLMEQNREKSTAYAKRSRAGERLTWIIPPFRGKWGLLANDKVEIACSFIAPDGAAVTSANALPTLPTSRPLASQAEKKSVLMKRSAPDVEEIDDDDKEQASDEKKEKVDSEEVKKLRLESRTYTLAVEFPKHWSTPLNKYQEIKLRPEDAEWGKLQDLMNRTLAPAHKERYKYSKLAIKKLVRLQNPDLWNHYFLRKKEVKYQNNDKPDKINGVLTDLLDATANEFYLFHGLNASIVDKISNYGFDERVSNLAGMFGCGIYFAENASKSVIYAHALTCPQSGAVYQGQANVCNCTGKNNVERVMFICRVCVGSAHVRVEATDKDKPLRRPPDRPDSGIPYDSVLGESSQWNPKAKLAFREFIVYDRRQCYPEYIVHFECKP